MTNTVVLNNEQREFVSTRINEQHGEDIHTYIETVDKKLKSRVILMERMIFYFVMFKAS